MHHDDREILIETEAEIRIEMEMMTFFDKIRATVIIFIVVIIVIIIVVVIEGLIRLKISIIQYILVYGYKNMKK